MPIISGISRSSTLNRLVCTCQQRFYSAIDYQVFVCLSTFLPVFHLFFRRLLYENIAVHSAHCCFIVNANDLAIAYLI